MAHVRPGELTPVEYRGYATWLFLYISTVTICKQEICAYFVSLH